VENTSSAQSSEEPKSLGATLVARIRAVFSNVNIQRRPRTLKLCETLSLGEKRLLLLVECENQRFLVAATPQNISLIQTLGVIKEGDRNPELP
jgi:flagellar biogenesis protein FliO